jgi:GGDEF domain-containing protein
MAPAVLAWQGLGDQPIDVAAIVVGSVVLFLLVVLRMAGLVAQVQDQAAQLAALAHNDALTGVPNRRAWEQEATAAWRTRMRGTDLLARYGGEEFAVLVRATAPTPCDRASSSQPAPSLTTKSSSPMRPGPRHPAPTPTEVDAAVAAQHPGRVGRVGEAPERERQVLAVLLTCAPLR